MAWRSGRGALMFQPASPVYTSDMLVTVSPSPDRERYFSLSPMVMVVVRRSAASTAMFPSRLKVLRLDSRDGHPPPTRATDRSSVQVPVTPSGFSPAPQECTPVLAT